MLFRSRWTILALLLITAITFLPVLNCDILNWDDDWMLMKNDLVLSISLSNIWKILTTVYFYNYHALVFLSYAFEYHFFEFNPIVYHATNLLFHLANVYLVYRLIKLLSGNILVAGVAALLFAIHPMKVESVAWITTRKDVMYSFFYIMGLIQYVKYFNSGKVFYKSKHYLLTALLFGLSFMCKGMAVTFSLAVICLDFYMRKKISVKSLLSEIGRAHV